MDAARAFFDEWDHRAPGSRRSLRRARLLIERLGGADPGVPVLTVVGSKGKGTAAAYASAWLAARGLRVLTVTSPPPRRDTERIRVGGAAISAAELAGLGARLGAAARGLPPEPGGHLSPSGLFTIAGMLHARATGAGAVVLEAGMGGASDEASLFPPDVVAITSVFAEHVGVLGDTPAEIAADKAGVSGPATAAVLSLPQTPGVAAAIAATVAARTCGRVGPEVVAAGASGVPERLLPAGIGRANAELGCVAAARLLAATLRPRPHAPGTPAGGNAIGPAPGTARSGRRTGHGRSDRSGRSAETARTTEPAGSGDAAAGPPEPLPHAPAGTRDEAAGPPTPAPGSPAGTGDATAGPSEPLPGRPAGLTKEAAGPPGPGTGNPAEAGIDAALERVLASVRLPGRASWHRVPGTGTMVFVDAAIDRSGAVAALAEAYRRVPRLDHVLACLPDHKDVAGVVAALDGLPVTYVTLRDHPHLRFTRAIPAGWAVMDAGELARDRLAGLGRHVVALGTGYFTARVLDLVDADTDRLFTS